MLQATKRRGMDNPVAVTLILGTGGAVAGGINPAPAIGWVAGKRGEIKICFA